MSLLIPIAASAATVVAVLFGMFATARWRERNPMFAPPARITMIMASAVALKGWFEVLVRSQEPR